MNKHLLPLVFLLLVAGPLFNTAVTFAASVFPAADNSAVSDKVSVRREILRGETESLEKLKNEVATLKKNREQKLSLLQEKTITGTIVEKARLTKESARVNVQSVKLDLINEQQKIQSLQTQITDLQHRIDALAGSDSREQSTDLHQKLQETTSLLSLARQHVKLLSKRRDLLQEKADLTRSWWQSVQAVYLKQQQILHQESLDDMKKRLQVQQEEVQKKSSELRKKLARLKADDPDTATQRELIGRQLEAMDESLNILRTKIKVQSMKSELDNFEPAGLLTLSSHRLQTDIEELKQIINRLQPMNTLTKSKLDVLQQQWALVQKQYALKNITRKVFAEEKKLLTNLIAQYNSLLEGVQSLRLLVRQELDRVENAYDKSVQQSLTARQSMPHDLDTWKSLLAEFADLPGKLSRITVNISNELVSGWKQSGPERRLIFLGTALALIFLTLALGRIPVVKDKQPQELRFSVKARAISSSLLKKSRLSISIGGMLLVAGWAFRLESKEFHVLFLFVSVCFVVQVAVKLSYWLFVSPLVPTAQRQPRLHHMIVSVLGLSAFFTLLVGLGNIGLFSLQLRNVIDRLFMLLLLVTVYFFMRLRATLIAGLHPETQSKFWVHLVALASLSIPLIALSAALVGLAGYINLAWFVAEQLGLFLAILFAWVILRDLIRDMLRNWKVRVEKKALNRNLPSSMLIVSLERIIDLLLFLVVLWCLAWMYGWGTGTAVDTFLKAWLNHPLFHMGKQVITLFDIMKSLFLFVLFLYLGSMARHLTYLWLYNNVSDRGLRNSLSIFTQYAVLIIGSLIALNALGINLTSLTVFAGALGVGIGFGLQHIANNLISGLILLAERPVRVDDWVSVGTSQGIITRIGLRSLILTTWDNQDVIIPNAQLISNPVTNWTLSNNLIRTVFQVGVRYQDDPHKAGDVIQEAVSMVPEVSLEQKPLVCLTEFADSSVNFRVVFFSEIENQHSRLTVKSKVMFAIWDALKEADIGIPFPQQDIYIKELPMGSGDNVQPPVNEESREKEDGTLCRTAEGAS